MIDDETPQLHPTQYKRSAPNSWTLSGIEQLPSGWVNVRIWSYDRSLGCDLYVIDECPGVIHRESCVEQTVLSWADPDGNIFNQYGELFDEHPVVIETRTIDPPYRIRDFVGPDWQPAITGGGYLGSCPQDMVAEVLREHGFEGAIPKPDDWVADDAD